MMTCFVLHYALQMTYHKCILTYGFECSDALLVVPSSDYSMKKSAVALQCSAVEWILTPLVKTAQVL